MKSNLKQTFSFHPSICILSLQEHLKTFFVLTIKIILLQVHPIRLFYGRSCLEEVFPYPRSFQDPGMEPLNNSHPYSEYEICSKNYHNIVIKFGLVSDKVSKPILQYFALSLAII